MISKILAGHYSEETAYLVADYPYGNNVRTQMKVWLHTDAKKGVRMMTRTLNPKTQRWNAPKASTYAFAGGGMYLDENGHVQWTSVTPYTDAKAALAFVEAFRGTEAITPNLQLWCVAKARSAEKIADGSAYFTINGVKKERSEAERERDQQEAAAWREVVAAIYLKPIEASASATA